jgi:uncharacterized caspase-like protein
LRAAVASQNVTVLTSSTGDEHTYEDEAWQHGAFTKVLLDALSSSARDVDTDHNGVISMSELVAYVATVRPEGANYLWRKIPPGELSIDPVADERLGWVTGRAGAS